jgi:hypothetical protein
LRPEMVGLSPTMTWMGDQDHAAAVARDYSAATR